VSPVGDNLKGHGNQNINVRNKGFDNMGNVGHHAAHNSR